MRVVSPGTLTDANYLDAREPAFLMAISRGTGIPATVWPCSTCPPASSRPPNTRARRAAGAARRTRRAAPARGHRADRFQRAGRDDRNAADPGCRHDRRAVDLRTGAARRALIEQLQTQSLHGFGLEGRPDAVRAAGALVQLSA